MTRKHKASIADKPQPFIGRWPLKDAKARFSELVRRALSDGPQHVTLHGRDAVVVVDADEFQRLSGGRTGELLIDALQRSPHRRTDIAPRGIGDACERREAVSGWLLDTNVISEVRKLQLHAKVLAFTRHSQLQTSPGPAVQSVGRSGAVIAA